MVEGGEGWKQGAGDRPRAGLCLGSVWQVALGSSNDRKKR